ncbi:extracellular calcium-sensing receptor [Brachyhypopomus gauderio]|uniref:extracellular calcium-sensing receptor n=1 Tax=Brachyhypopomus gauderio TaxID=698409 RepID=UPI00404252CB
MTPVLLCLLGLTISAPSATSDLQCILQNVFKPGFMADGHFIIGGIFPLHYNQEMPDLNFTYKPGSVKCNGVDPRAFRWALGMKLAVEEINNNRKLLPDHTLGYKIFDSCAYPLTGQRASLAVLNGQNEADKPMCSGAGPVVAIIGESGSAQSIVLSRILRPFMIPMISYFSSCACLSDRREFPTFFRTIPSDAYQVKAIAKLLLHFNWTWVGVVRGDHAYGQFALQGLLKELEGTSVCLAYQEMIPLFYDTRKALEIIHVINSSSAQVVVVFSAEGELTPFLKDCLEQNLTGIQWIASEAWVTASVFTGSKYYPLLGGTIGFGIRQGHIPGLQEYLMLVNPETQLPNCTGQETLNMQHAAYMNTSSTRITYNVYKGVYAIAHSLHNLISCNPGNGPFINSTCADVTKIYSWQLQHYLQEVSFTISGERVNFDLKGDSIPSYDLINWQRGTAGNIELVKVGMYDEAREAGSELLIYETALLPVSICSDSCPSGFRKAVRNGEPLCCFDCVPCDSGKISNQTDSIDCMACPENYWSSDDGTACIPKVVEFLSHDSMGVTLTVIAVVGACVTLTVFTVFLYHRKTPIVRINNSELSFFILLSLTLCFLCALIFIGEPTSWSCMLRHTAFSITFSLCISCILGKTLVVLAAFTATQPGNNVMKWLGPVQQRIIIFSCTLVQMLICTAWLISSPPFPYRNTQYQHSKVILDCSVGSDLAFWCVLGYIGLLAGLCFVLAFLARKLPGNFNEAKYITFSMLIFCAVWLAFVPAYVSSPGKFTTAVEIFAILASSFGLLVCLFAPKCYIILFHPEKNTKQHLMGKDK